MGRLRKKKIEEIQRLYEKGFLKKEIAENLKISRTTVGKYTPREKTTHPPLNLSPIVEALVKSSFQILFSVHYASNPKVYGDIEDARGLMRTVADMEALNLMTWILKYDKHLGQRVLERNSYLYYLENRGILQFTTPAENLNQKDRDLRKQWIQLFKAFYPEKIAELLRSS